jgi:hypothetical protein
VGRRPPAPSAVRFGVVDDEPRSLVGLEHSDHVVLAVPSVLHARARAVFGTLVELPEQPVQFVCPRQGSARAPRSSV